MDLCVEIVVKFTPSLFLPGADACILLNINSVLIHAGNLLVKSVSMYYGVFDSCVSLQDGKWNNCVNCQYLAESMDTHMYTHLNQLALNLYLVGSGITN